jgi:hypothetical protein
VQHIASLLRVLLAGVIFTAFSVSAPPARAADVPLDPHVFRIPASQFPWHTKKLLDARVEANDRAQGDAIVIYDAIWAGLPTWSQLNRQTGWYEDALMRQGRKNPAVVLLVSQYASVLDARRALDSEKQFQSYRPLTASLAIGDESYEYASSTAVIYGGKPSLVDDVVVCTRIQNVELDVAVFDVHPARYRWFKAYASAALQLAGQLTAVGQRAVTSPETAGQLPPTGIGVQKLQ